MTDYTNEVLADRAHTHGDYAQVARLSQELKRIMRCGVGFTELPAEHQESLEMLAVKIARIVSGRSVDDHWADIEGYARLARHQLSSSVQAAVVDAEIAALAAKFAPVRQEAPNAPAS